MRPPEHRYTDAAFRRQELGPLAYRPVRNASDPLRRPRSRSPRAAPREPWLLAVGLLVGLVRARRALAGLGGRVGGRSPAARCSRPRGGPLDLAAPIEGVARRARRPAVRRARRRAVARGRSRSGRCCASTFVAGALPDARRRDGGRARGRASRPGSRTASRACSPRRRSASSSSCRAGCSASTLAARRGAGHRSRGGRARVAARSPRRSRSPSPSRSPSRSRSPRSRTPRSRAPRSARRGRAWRSRRAARGSSRARARSSSPAIAFGVAGARRARDRGGRGRRRDGVRGRGVDRSCSSARGSCSRRSPGFVAAAVDLVWLGTVDRARLRRGAQ